MRFEVEIRSWLSTLLCVIAILLGPAHSASAHEVRPAYLEIIETAPNRYDLLWRVPVLNGNPLPVILETPEDARDIALPDNQELRSSHVERRQIEIARGLGGRRIDFIGLEATITDVLVRVQWLNGEYSTSLVHPSKPCIMIPEATGVLNVASAYLVQGISHILNGVDHLLFVLGLMLLVQTRWMLIKTITAFTIAHSITLALATFGIVAIS